MEFQTININDTEIIGIANEDGFFYPSRFYATQDTANVGMLELATSEITRVNTFYDSRRKVNEDGSLAKPGRRSDADMATVALAQSWIDSLQAEATEREAVEKFLASLSPEKRALLEG